jgi:hypothetical protein
MTGTFIISGHEVSFSRLFGKGGDSDAESLGLSSILFSVSESGVFGNADQVDDTQLMKVLMKLLDDAMKAENLEKELKKRKQS